MGGGASPLNTGGGMSGGQTQLPNFAAPQQQPMQQQPFGGGQGQTLVGTMTPEQVKPYANAPMTAEEAHRYQLKMGYIGNPGNKYLQQPPQYQQPFGNQFGGGFGGGQQPMPQPIGVGQQQQPTANIMQGAFGNLARAALGAKQLPQQPTQGPSQQQPEMMMSDMQYRPERQQPFGGQFGQPMQNPFQPQQPSFMQDPEFQGYQTQVQDLNRQMDEYMRKAPMYQQLQDLQNKMAPFQQRYQQQQMQAMQQRQFQQPSPFRRGQFQQPMGLMGLMGGRGGRGGMQQPSMSMDMPYARGFSSELPTYFMKKGGKV